MSLPDQRTFTFVVFVTPGFNSFATMGFVDPFRAANYLVGRQLFRWVFVSEAGGLCYGSNGAGVECDRLDTASHSAPDIALISSSWTPEYHGSAKVLFAIRSWARAGVTIAGLDTGAFIIAQSGFLDNRRATVHYEHIDSLREQYPNVDVVEDLFTFDGSFLTCCGGTSAVDFGLHLLKQLSGAALANAAARYIFQPGLRETSASQKPAGAEPLGALVPDDVKAIVRLMEENLEDPLPIPHLCERVGVSHRQVTRLFSRYIKKSPALYYRDIRLDRARGLVTQTEMQMSEIAVASGFSSQVHFSRAYKERFGLPPIRDRVEGRIPFEFRAWPMYSKTFKNPENGQKK